MTKRVSRDPRRLHELEQRFGALFEPLQDSPQKEALSILHGITQELWRQLRRSSPAVNERGLTLEDIADLYRHAPRMEGPAQWALSRSGLRQETNHAFRRQSLVSR